MRKIIIIIIIIFCMSLLFLFSLPNSLQVHYQKQISTSEFWKNITMDELNSLLKSGINMNRKTRYGNGTYGIGILPIIVSNCTNPKIIEKILKTGIKFNENSNDGHTLLMFAAANNSNPKVIELLLKNGSNISKKEKDSNIIGKFLHIWWNPVLFVRLTGEILISGIGCSCGHEPDSIITISGTTAFLLAATNNSNYKVIKYLLKNGAKIDEKTKYGTTALMSASKNNSNPEILKFLLKNGAKINEKDIYGSTPLMYSISGSLSNLKILLKNGAKINERDNEGKSALFYAIKENKNIEIVELLLENGIDVKIKDNSGHTVLFYAEKQNFKKVVTLLKSTIKN